MASQTRWAGILITVSTGTVATTSPAWSAGRRSLPSPANEPRCSPTGGSASACGRSRIWLAVRPPAQSHLCRLAAPRRLAVPERPDPPHPRTRGAGSGSLGLRGPESDRRLNNGQSAHSTKAFSQAGVPNATVTLSPSTRWNSVSACSWPEPTCPKQPRAGRRRIRCRYSSPRRGDRRSPRRGRSGQSNEAAVAEAWLDDDGAFPRRPKRSSHVGRVRHCGPHRSGSA
jgi:hypothetical protein